MPWGNCGWWKRPSVLLTCMLRTIFSYKDSEFLPSPFTPNLWGHCSQGHLLIMQIRVRDYKAITVYVSSTFHPPSFFSQDYSWSLSLSLFLTLTFYPVFWIIQAFLSSRFLFILFCSLLEFPFPEFQLGWIQPILSMTSHLLRQVFSVDFFLLFLSYSLIHLVIPLMSMITS